MNQNSDQNYKEATETITDSVRQQLDDQFNPADERLPDDPSRNDIGVSVHAGFPNAASDRQGRLLDFNDLLVRNSVSTFTFRIRGDNHQARGIFDGDIAVIDRALSPVISDLMICWDEDGFVLSTYRGQAGGEIMIWGVVTAIIHQLRKPPTEPEILQP